MVKARVWVMAKRFHGLPKLKDFAIIKQDLPPLKNGEYLTEAMLWSPDPYNRTVAGQLPDGSPMVGFQVAKIVESESSKFPVGEYVVAESGWRTHSVMNEVDSSSFPAYIVPPPQQLQLSLNVGSVGVPGLTAYFGLLEKCEPVAGETVAVSAASGAVGSVAGQIAKIKVGGTFAIDLYEHLNAGARICQCGSISEYNATETPKMPDFRMMFILKEVILRGINIAFHAKRFPQGLHHLAQWVKEGKLKSRETVYSGFDQMPQALIDVLAGKNNIGKVVVMSQ